MPRPSDGGRRERVRATAVCLGRRGPPFGFMGELRQRPGVGLGWAGRGSEVIPRCIDTSETLEKRLVRMQHKYLYPVLDKGQTWTLASALFMNFGATASSRTVCRAGCLRNVVCGESQISCQRFLSRLDPRKRMFCPLSSSVSRSTKAPPLGMDPSLGEQAPVGASQKLTSNWMGCGMMHARTGWLKDVES